MKRIRRLLSKRSGFTLVEIIVAFAVFAIMTTMIVQILNMISQQRRSNFEYANQIDEQEHYLVTHDKLGYNDANSNNGTLSLDFGEDKRLIVDYQMYGASPTGEVDGLAYYVSKEGKRDENSSGGDDPDDPDDEDDNTGAQTDRMRVRIAGTRGFDFISVNKVELVGKDGSGNATYSFDLCASANGMRTDDIPYAMYRLYFYKDGNQSTEHAKILSATYVGTGAAVGTNWQTSSPDPTGNPFVVVRTGDNGIVVSTPFKASASNGGSTQKYKCSLCGTIYNDNNSGYSHCPNGTGYYDPCHNHLAPYNENESSTGDTYTGNGIKFTTDKHTKIQITFAGDPGITVESFGENFTKMPDGSCQYKSGTLSNGIATGSNIYGAYPKN